jgi:hypothetical protein
MRRPICLDPGVVAKLKAARGAPARGMKRVLASRKNCAPKLIDKDVGLLVGQNIPLNFKSGKFRRGLITMRTKNEVVASIAGLVLALAALPSVSRAAIVETIFDIDTDATVGSITFPTLDGSSDAGVLFSFDGFTQANITSISWTLDPTTADVVALNLNALQGDNPCPNGGDCSNSTVALSPTLAQMSSTSCSLSGIGDLCQINEPLPADIRFVLVPEPSTWAMLLAGFAGLGFLAWRGSRKTTAHAA